jgi:CHAT domain-containing protein
VVVFGGLPACRWQSRSFSSQYQQLNSAYEHGELDAAQREADAARRRYEPSDPAGAYRFRVLEAEILSYAGRSNAAFDLLAPEPPAGAGLENALIRRRLLQSFIAADRRQFDSAARFLQEAKDLAGSHPELMDLVGLTEGYAAIWRGDYDTANRSLRRALQLALDRKDAFVQARLLNTLGWMFMRLQKPGEAIDQLNAARRVAQSSGSRGVLARILGNLGGCYLRLGDEETALALDTEAEVTAAASGMEGDQAYWLIDIGGMQFSQRDYAAAQSSFEQALGIAERVGDGFLKTISLNDLATTALVAGQFDQAERYGRQSREWNRATGDVDSELYSRLNAARIAAGRHEDQSAESGFRQLIAQSGERAAVLRWLAHTFLGDLYARQGKFARAGQEFRLAIALADSARSALAKEEYRLSFLSNVRDMYDDYIAFLVSRGRLREALQVAEHARARTMAEGLGIEDRLGTPPASAEQTARNLNSVILSYWLESNRSFLWAITARGVFVFPLPAEAEIDGAVRAYSQALAGPVDVRDTNNAHGRRLYDMLVAPAGKLVPSGSRVIIVPDGSLYSLNFETLLVPAPQVHYWIEDVIVSNASSLALLAASGRRRPAESGRLLLLGDPVQPNSEYPELSQAKQEMEQVERHFSPEQRRVIAREKAVPRAYGESHPAEFGYIHIVAHAMASRLSPLDSGVILSRDGDSYKLYAREIMQQPLRAELVTVSACHSAGARALGSEGLVGLAWAFLRAGAHQVIAALWEVNDASTPQLMDTMYGELTLRRDPVLALHHAKLAMLHAPGVRHRPFYWAAFQIYTGR